MARWPKSPQEGEPLRAEWGRAVVEILTQVVRPKPPLKFERNKNGVVLTMEDVDGGLSTCKSPPGGIAPGATADCYRYKFGTHGTITTTQVTITNPGPDGVPGNRKVWYGNSNGVPMSALFWSCAEVE
jgi:hypothetical protein